RVLFWRVSGLARGERRWSGDDGGAAAIDVRPVGGGAWRTVLSLYDLGRGHADSVQWLKHQPGGAEASELQAAEWAICDPEPAVQSANGAGGYADRTDDVHAAGNVQRRPVHGEPGCKRDEQEPGGGAILLFQCADQNTFCSERGQCSGMGEQRGRQERHAGDERHAGGESTAGKCVPVWVYAV